MKHGIGLALLALVLSGCVKEDVLLTVKPDGSGTIRIQTEMNAATVAMIKQATAGLGAAGATNGADAEIFSEDDVKSRGRDYGTGVTFDSFKRLNENGREGVTANFNFADIRTVRMPLGKTGEGTPGSTSPAPGSEEAVTFDFNPGTPATLTVRIPQQKEEPKTPATENGTTPDELAGMSAAMMQMFKGLEMRCALRVEGDVTSSTASHPVADGKGEVLLMALRFDDLLESPDFMKIIESSSGERIPTAQLLGRKGFTYETKPEIRIEFR